MADLKEDEGLPIAFECWADELLHPDQEQREGIYWEDVRRVREALIRSHNYGLRRGAAVAFGLMGMAEAVRVSDLQRKSPTGCRVCPPSSYCHHCGAVWWSCLCPDRDE